MRTVIVGAGLGGLAAGLRLGRSGHQVTIIDRDPAPPEDVEHSFADWSKGRHRDSGLRYAAPLSRLL